MQRETDFKRWFEGQDGLYLTIHSELREMLSQGNAVYLRLDLPGGQSRVTIGFPVPFHVRVHDGMDPRHPLIASADKERSVYHVPKIPRYRYGTVLTPWMFDHIFDPRARLKGIPRHMDVNYIQENGSSGFSGVVIRVERRKNLSEEKLEIYSFDTGNDYHFKNGWREHPNTKFLACYVPENTRALSWKHRVLQSV